MVFHRTRWIPICRFTTTWLELSSIRKMSKNPDIDQRGVRSRRHWGITHFCLDRKPKQLCRRSAPARRRPVSAIVREPKVFLFDEPRSNLDAKLGFRRGKRALGISKDSTNASEQTFTSVRPIRSKRCTMATRIAGHERWWVASHKLRPRVRLLRSPTKCLLIGRGRCKRRLTQKEQRKERTRKKIVGTRGEGGTECYVCHKSFDCRCPGPASSFPPASIGDKEPSFPHTCAGVMCTAHSNCPAK